jgi:DNA-binding NtrC family response regulator
VRKKYPDVQVIILTGHGTEKDEKEARKLGAYDYLQKPADVDSLVKVIKNAFAYKQKFEKTMTATAFAEEGDYKTARKIMESDKDPDSGQNR